MGFYGSSGIKEVFVGLNIEKVVCIFEIFVLVIKYKVKDFKLEDVVFVLNFDIEVIIVFRKVKKFFDVFGVKMKFVFINIFGDGFRSIKEMNEKMF